MLHVGVDLHKQYSQVSTLDQRGEIREERIEHEGGAREGFLQGLEPGSRIAVEATGSWGWFVDLAESYGHEVVRSNPKQTKAIARARLKNDRVDAERLAWLLAADLLPSVWIPPAPPRIAAAIESESPTVSCLRWDGWMLGSESGNHWGSRRENRSGARWK